MRSHYGKESYLTKKKRRAIMAHRPVGVAVDPGSHARVGFSYLLSGSLRLPVPPELAHPANRQR